MLSSIWRFPKIGLITPNLKTFKRIAHHKQSVRGYPYDLGKHHIPIFKILLKKT